MRLFLHSFAATPVAVLFSAGFAVAAESPAAVSACADGMRSAPASYAAAARASPPGMAGQRVLVEIDLAASPGYAVDAGHVHYRMLFNDVAEGWSWQPLTRGSDEDYFRWKFFPLGTAHEERASYVQEEKIGEPQTTRVQWRYDYFLAFDNAYDFYVRRDDDEAGFSLPLATHAAVDTTALRLRAIAVLDDPATRESTTYWKAIHARPVDFTLKKRYLIGRLERLVLCDAAGRELARLPAEGAAQR